MTSLRERKKQRTREQIVHAALELFAERGFEGTTITDIAEAADISPRTFFGYFPSKEDVVFHDAEAVLGSFREHLQSRAEDEDVFEALRSWALRYEADADYATDEECARRQLVRDTPVLAARERAHVAAVERILAEAVADDLGVDRDSLRPHLVGAAAIAALEAVGRLHDKQGSSDPARSAEDVLDEALTFLQGGLDALRRRSPNHGA